MCGVQTTALFHIPEQEDQDILSEVEVEEGEEENQVCVNFVSPSPPPPPYLPFFESMDILSQVERRRNVSLSLFAKRKYKHTMCGVQTTALFHIPEHEDQDILSEEEEEDTRADEEQVCVWN